MATILTFLANVGNSLHDYATHSEDYLTLDLANDYLIWTEGNTVIKDHMEEDLVTDINLNEASVIITDEPYTVPLCLVYDDSHDFDGDFYTQKIEGMSLNARYVFCFSFDGATATEPQLEAWDNSYHNTTAKNVLGIDDPADSMIYAVCTTSGLPVPAQPPETEWVGTAIAGSDPARVLKLNNGTGALGELESGETSQELYANIQIVIPGDYPTPAVEAFVLTVRYSWN